MWRVVVGPVGSFLSEMFVWSNVYMWMCMVCSIVIRMADADGKKTGGRFDRIDRYQAFFIGSRIDIQECCSGTEHFQICVYI